MEHICSCVFDVVLESSALYFFHHTNLSTSLVNSDMYKSNLLKLPITTACPLGLLQATVNSFWSGQLLAGE